MRYRLRVIPLKKWHIMQSSTAMKNPYGLQIIESCLACPLVKDRIFCDLPADVIATLDAISSAATYPKDAILFVEGQEPRGAFVICNGRVKMSTSSADGKSIIVRVVEAGEIIGLPGTISGKPYEFTAQGLETLQVNFIPREAFLDFLRKHGEAAVRVAEMLSHIYHATLAEVRYLGLSETTAEKLARFLLDLPCTPQAAGHPRTTLTLTHSEIAEIIGASRETVTRLFASFKREGYIEVHGSAVVFVNKPALQKVI